MVRTLPWRTRPCRIAVPLGVVAVVLMLVSTVGASCLAFAPGPHASEQPGGGLPPTGGATAGPAPVTAAATAALTVSPTSAVVGTEVTFSATSFAHASAFSITSSAGVTACSGTTSSKGAFSCSYVIPPTGGGNETFTGTDAKGTSASAPFRVVPDLILNPSSGLVGTPITFVGTGFSATPLTGGKQPRAYVTWTSPAGPAVACSNQTLTASNGTFTCSYTMPAAPAGAHAFLGASVDSTLSADGTFTMVPGLAVAPTHGPIGTPVTFAGTGFGANLNVNVTWFGGALACSNATLNTGSFSCSSAIPTGVAGGQYTFSATDTDKNLANASFTVTGLSVLPISVPVNATVVFSGAGFDPNAVMNLTWAYGYVCAGEDATSAGTYSCTFHVPATPTGAYAFTASDGRGDYATTSLTIEPFLTVSPNYGDSGTLATFTGTGFGSGLSVTVTWVPNGSSVVAFSTTASTNGSFSDPFAVNVPLGGPYLFTATDSASHTATATFGVSLLTATPAGGPNGTKLPLVESGFAPSTSSAKVTLTISSSIGVSCKGTTTSQGSYECNVTVGYVPAGAYALIAQVGSDNANATFTVIPHLWVTLSNSTSQHVILPLKFTPTGFAALAPVEIVWASNGTTACTATTTASGATNCTVAQFPAVPASPYIFTAQDGFSHAASATVTVVPWLKAAPSSGKSGTTVTFTGYGFSATSLFNVTSTLGSACNGTTWANGTFSCTYVLPHAPSGKYKFTATDALGYSASVNVKIGPQLLVSPTTGAVGTLVVFSGSGFAPGKTANVTVNFTKTGAGVLACSATVSSAGNFGCTYSMGQASLGTYMFTARDWNYPNRPYGNNATANFTISPSLTVSPSSGVVGTTVEFAGEGYTADVGISVTWSGGTACSATTNASGTFHCSFTIRPSPAGPEVFTAATSVTVSASATFLVVSQITLSPSQGPVGTSIALNGSGFVALAQVTISWSGGVACAMTTSAQGSFSCPSYIVPATPAGSYVFTASVNSSAITNQSFTVLPGLTVSPNAGPVGTKVMFRATGFGARVAITIASTLGTACSSTTAANGSYTCNYTVPMAPGGSYAFTASDGTHKASTSFTIGTVVSVSPTLGPVGTAIRFTATGFAASTAMTITWNSGSVVCSGATGAAGGFSCNTTMPAAPLGSHMFTATAGPSATTNFTVRPQLTVSPGSGGDGTRPTFTGTGFPALTSVNVTWSGPTWCTATTASSGGFNCSLLIPNGTAGGVYRFTATDAYADTANATFLVVTGLQASPDHGPDLTIVTFNGSNFAPSVSVNVTSSISGAPACTATTNATGSFSCTYTIPASTPGGTINFTATDALSHSASVLFTVTFLTASPTGVEIGTHVSLVGGGFDRSAPFTVTDPWATACSGTTDAAGAFSCSTTIPTAAKPGAYNFTATDGTDVAQAGFGVFAIAAPTALPTSADIGQTVTFTVVASGGSGALTYAWHDLPPGCSGTTASVTCLPTGAVVGASITVTVTDSNGYSVTSPALTFTVYTDPTQSPPTPSLTSADLGQTVTFTASVSGGSGGGTYAWTASGLGCTASTGPTLSCTPTATGSFTVSYAWTDSNGMAATGSTSLSFTVNANPTQAPPTASRSSADVGQTVTFTASVSDGSGGGTFAWTFAPALGCTASTSSKLVCTPTGSGALEVSFVWTDSNGIVATGSTSLTYTVYSDVVVQEPTASVASADVNQSVKFSVSASGGSGDLTYAWLGLPEGCAGSQATLTCEPTAALVNGSITVKVTDSNGFSATSAALQFTVYPDPIVAKPTPSVASADIGQWANFTTTASGGFGTLTYAWTVPTALNCAASTTSKLSCKPTAAVVGASITVTVTDSNGYSVTSPALTFTVYTDPAQISPIPSRSSVDVGQTVTFTASVSGGSGGGTYAWTASGLGCTASTGPTLSCTPTATGSFTVSYAWTDSNGMAATGTTSLPFSVYANPYVTAPIPSHATADVGESITFTTTAAGGPDGYTYFWILPTGLGCAAANASQIACIPTGHGNYTVSVYVVDLNGVQSPTVSSSLFEVYAAPSVTVPYPSNASVDAGQSVTFKTNASGGAGTLLYTWAESPSSGLGCSPSNSATLLCTPTSKGVYAITVYVTDANGVVSSTQTLATFTVYANPALTTPSPSHTSADVGESITFTTTPTGGAGTFTYTWTAPQGMGCTLADLPQITCVPIANGNYTVTVSAIDGNRASTGTEASALFPVYGATTVATPTPSRSSADVGQGVTFSATVTGGLKPYTYTWTAWPGLGCVLKTTSSISCRPTVAGSFTVNVTATDANGVASSLATRTGYEVYVLPSVTLQASSSSILQGHSVTFTATESGGSGGTVYTWQNLPTGCATPKTSTLTVSCTPSAAGSYTITITAMDSNNASVLGNVTITVQPSLFGLPQTEAYIIVLIAIFAGIAALVVGLRIVVRRRRAKRQQTQF